MGNLPEKLQTTAQELKRFVYWDINPRRLEIKQRPVGVNPTGRFIFANQILDLPNY